MDSKFFKDLFKKYYEKIFDNYKIIEKEFNINKNQYIEINLDKNIYYNVFNIDNSEVKIRINNNDTSMIYNEFNIIGKVKINILINNSGNLRIYNLYKVNSNSSSDSIEKIYNKNNVVLISKIFIDKNSENSEGKLSQYLFEENGISILLPILDIENNKSKGFHGSKILKLTEKEENYLRYLSLNKEEIKNILMREFNFI
ncbi:SufD family Fe-S cluster assembly protein [Candidatus Nanobsidianus stetteri]|uniref:SufD family Fe-S cluster assembly protein n=1 Tax=Nanobsidianus stetteri TaxID=1294122 RepID=A0A2T9WLY0_NANST|nr:SufD family Fe-S cluster assembly protein [Candidatus Nanobsidianus stetteri]MCC5446842.1 SufD family Fe-S cluster assembly protein [Candidatus Nanobsidianus stetteri]